MNPPRVGNKSRKTRPYHGGEWCLSPSLVSPFASHRGLVCHQKRNLQSQEFPPFLIHDSSTGVEATWSAPGPKGMARRRPLHCPGGTRNLNVFNGHPLLLYIILHTVILTTLSIGKQSLEGSRVVHKRYPPQGVSGVCASRRTPSAHYSPRRVSHFRSTRYLQWHFVEAS